MVVEKGTVGVNAQVDLLQVDDVVHVAFRLRNVSIRFDFVGIVGYCGGRLLGYEIS